MLHFDRGNNSVYEFSGPDVSIKRNEKTVKMNFNLNKLTIIKIQDSQTIESSSFLFSPATLHIIFSTISAFILILVGFVNLSRNAINRLNQVFLGFYTFIGLFQLFDAIILVLGTDVDLSFNNFIRDLMIGSLILGLFSGILGILIIYYVESFIFNTKILAIEIFLGLILFIVSLLGDSVYLDDDDGAYGGSGAHIEPIRDLFGWVGISGLFLVSVITIIFILGSLILNIKTDKQLKRKLSGLLTGLVITIISLFDISFAIPIIRDEFLGNSLIHVTMHLVIVSGATLILSTYISSYYTKKVK